MYNCNDSSLHYKTMTLTNFVSPRSINYDSKVSCKLKHTFTIVNYNRKTFTVQATDLLDKLFQEQIDLHDRATQDHTVTPIPLISQT